MCGICGFVGGGDELILQRMMSEMRYRGPDDSGYWHDERGVHLGQLRLSIVDLGDGRQPMVSIDGSIVVVFNGEIYNHRELRKELEGLGHQFQTSHSDTEILIHGYRQWGKELSHRLNGMWAFVIFDRHKDFLWLSRDRFGKKPLYYTLIGEALVFSSELASLAMHPLVRPTVDREALKKFFAHGYVPAPTTMLQQVKKLPAGHNGFFDLAKKSLTIEQYWRFQLEPDDTWLHRQEELQHLLVEHLYQAVATRLQADVPVGIFLSGGVDSSTVAAMALTVNRSASVQTYSIGFEEESFDESPYSDEMASVLGTKHTTEVLSASRCIDLLDTIYSRLDEPMADASLVPSFLMCKLASNDVKVALGGDGADELFAGYDPFRALSSARRYATAVPEFAHNLLSFLVNSLPVSHKNMSLEFKAKRFLSALGYESKFRNPIWLGPLPPDQLSDVFGQAIDLNKMYFEAVSAWEFPKSVNDVDRTLQFYTELYLQDDILVKMDRAGMLNSLEVRSPFLDINVVDLVRTIPAALKFDGKQTKYILKKALASVLPVEILYRSKKGFGIPVGQWFKSKAIEINPDALDGLIDTKVTKKIYQEHLKGKADWRAFLWAHFVMERWLDKPMFSQAKQ